MSTSTPSATAWSTAATVSAVVQPSCVGSGAVQQALYTASRAAGAIPEVVPKRWPSTSTRTPWSPAAVEATCEPWPVPSRGERYSAVATFSSPNPFTNQRAETTLSLQSSAVHSWASSQAPWKPGRCPAVPGVRCGSPLKLGLSGQMPVSTTPITTLRPAFSGPPCAAHTPPGPSSPSRLRELLPTAGVTRRAAGARSTCCFVLRSTSSTPGVVRSRVTWSLVSVAANPFSAVV